MNTPAMPFQRTYALGIDRSPEFRMAYQPIIKFDTDGSAKPFAYEGLLRVEDEGAITSAERHIIHHEREGSIARIDCWVIIQAMSFLSAHPDSNIWLNASRISLCNNDYINDLIMLLSYTQNQNRITLEVTESGQVDPVLLDHSLARLSAAGVKIVIDDLWDGFNHEDMLTADYVVGCKLSGTTMTKMLECELVKGEVMALLDRCKFKGKMVVIEGIETVESLELARRVGFEYFQGWLFGKPVHL